MVKSREQKLGKMARVRWKITRPGNIITLITSFGIVATFIGLQNKQDISHPSEAGYINQDNNIHGTSRSLLKFTFRRKKLNDGLWTAEQKPRNSVFDMTRNEKSDILALEIQNKLLGKNLPKVITLTSETTPSVTDIPTRPITTQSDTTPIFTNSPTSPITTESITTPIVTLAGEKEVTTEKD